RQSNGNKKHIQQRPNPHAKKEKAEALVSQSQVIHGRTCRTKLPDRGPGSKRLRKGYPDSKKNWPGTFVAPSKDRFVPSPQVVLICFNKNEQVVEKLH